MKHFTARSRLAISGTMLLALCACTTMQATPYVSQGAQQYAPSNSGQVDILYSNPARPFVSVGTVTAKKYQPGWTDPTVSDAIPQLRAAAAQLGADGVIIRSQRAMNDRHIVVEGEAIRYTDVQHGGYAAPTPGPPATNAQGAYANPSGPAARALLQKYQCGDNFSLISDSGGKAIFEATCRTGKRQLVECRGSACSALN